MERLRTIKAWAEDGYDIDAYTVPDDFQDTSWLGEYSERPYDGRQGIAVPPVDTRGGYLLRGQHYYYPQPGCEEYWQQDEERLRNYYLEGWALVTVEVVASRAGVELGTAYLGNVEDDDEAHLVDVAKEIAPEAIEEAREKLAELGAR